MDSENATRWNLKTLQSNLHNTPYDPSTRQGAILISRILNWLHPVDNTPAEIRRAQQLIRAIDAGGIPLDPARIVRIAEDLGLEVSKKAPLDKTIERIRKAIERY